MKIKSILTMFLIVATLVGCGGTGTPSSKENIVKIRSINASEAKVEPVSVKARNKKEANDTETEDNYIIITKDVTDVQFTITLDNPEAYGIDALRVTCDDPEAQIQIEGEWKPISQEANGTRVVNWSSEDPYEKTYNIRTTSLEDLYTFKVVDIRLAGHDTFLSKQTNSTDFGNNELDIYKMDTDAYELDVVSNTFEEIKFGIKVKEGVTNLSNFKVDGKEPDENGYWVMNESKEDCEISYDFELENGIKVSRRSQRWIGPMEIYVYDYFPLNYCGPAEVNDYFYGVPLGIYSCTKPTAYIIYKDEKTELYIHNDDESFALYIPEFVLGSSWPPYSMGNQEYREFLYNWSNNLEDFTIEIIILNNKIYKYKCQIIWNDYEDCSYIHTKEMEA